MFNHAYLPGLINRDDDKFGALPESVMWKKDGGWGPLLPFEQWPEHARLKVGICLRLIARGFFAGSAGFFAGAGVTRGVCQV
jgi:hypothetical protein